jgi:hypothetical protein
MFRNGKLSLWLLAFSFLVALSLPAQTFSPWSKVENLGPIVNSTAGDSCLFVTRSGLSLYFGSTRPGGLGALDLYVSSRATKSDPWGAPQSLGAKMNSTGNDHLPYITPDGHTMIFASNRPGGAGGDDLFLSFRRNAADDLGWETPVALTELNTAAVEYAPWGFIDGAGTLTLYFASDRAGGAGLEDIYASTLQADNTFSTPVAVAGLNTSASDVMPTIREDGLEMFLTSNRTGGLGSADIWTAVRGSTSEPWSAPRLVAGPVNSTSGEQRGSTIGDGTELYFFSGRPGGTGGTDLYRATRTRTTFVPVVGRAAGAHGSTFVTSAQLSNPGEHPASGHLVFHPAGVEASASDPFYAYRLGPYESLALPDLMTSIGTVGIGSLEIVPDEGPAPASTIRIESGVNSVVVPAVGPDALLTKGMHSAVKMPSGQNRFRTNVGVRAFESGATIWVCMHQPDGTYIRGFTREFAPNTLLQMSIADLYEGPVEPDQMVMFTVNAGSAVIYVSTVENNGSSSTLQLVQPVGN